ncbi:50S ribosomal protein L15 [Candidatus Parcubacteria bacterium]|nr:50S ribosomal protein L15 [Candidatus Parcubacteria bacterium]
MQRNTLTPRTPRMKSARVGRGGKRGKTSGRGTKGQKARAGRKMRPEIRDLIKKLPKRRGFGVNRARTVRPRTPGTVINIGVLEHVFSAGDTVTSAVLVKQGLVRLRGGKMPSVKILGTGELTKNLSLSGLSVSASAKAAIEKAGGSVL